MVPSNPDETVVANVRALLSQDELWVTRSRWPRWLEQGDPADAITIASMFPDDRLAARVWLRQQRHVLHRALGGEGPAAPDGWLAEQPLYRGLGRRAGD